MELRLLPNEERSFEKAFFDDCRGDDFELSYTPT
jgi:hypothetical protein